MKRWFLLLMLVASIGCVSNTQENPTKPVPSAAAPSLTVNQSDMTEQLLLIAEENMQLKQQLHDMNLSLEHYKSELLTYQELFRGSCATNASGFYGQTSLDAPAVKQKIVSEGTFPFVMKKLVTEGQMLTISVEVAAGKGRIMVVTNPRMGTIFQDAANTATILAENRTGKNLAGSDVIFSVNGSEIMAVDGPSAGALMTTLLIGALENSSFNKGITMTGTISQDGRVGAISGVVDKAEAAKDSGKTLILFPKGNSKFIKWDEKLLRHGLITYTTKVQVEVDTEKYIEENVGIEVEFVETIDDALKHFLQEEI